MATDVRKLAQDAAYIGVGVGVIAFQRAQVARRETRARVEAQVKEARQLLVTGVDEARSTAKETRALLGAVVTDVRSKVQPLAGQVQEHLPEPIAKVVERGVSLLPTS